MKGAGLEGGFRSGRRCGRGLPDPDWGVLVLELCSGDTPVTEAAGIGDSNSGPVKFGVGDFGSMVDEVLIREENVGDPTLR